jgi:hypothetical protein
MNDNEVPTSPRFRLAGSIQLNGSEDEVEAALDAMRADAERLSSAKVDVLAAEIAASFDPDDGWQE